MRLALVISVLILVAAGVAWGQDMVAYDDQLENGWMNYGWATLNYSNTSPVEAGSDSISVIDPGSNYEALYLGHSAFATTPYQSISFWIYPTAAGANELLVEATINGNTANAGVKLSFTAAQVGHWQQETIPLASLGVANAVAFTGFWIQNQTGGALTFYVDNVSMLATPPPTQVNLSVDANAVIRTIDSRTYGMNIAMWDSLLSSTATPALAAAMQTGAFRFPGGSSSDDYDWQVDKMVSNPSFQWASNAATFARVTSGQGAQAYVTVNYGSGTPQEAAAWVAYYNGDPANTSMIGMDVKGRDWKTVGYWAAIRVAGPLASDDGYNFLRVAHSAPYGFKYWELGNECYGGWENDLHGASGSVLTGSAHDPYTYAQAFQSYDAQMHAVDATIKLGAVSTPGEDSYGIGTHGVANPNEGNSVHTGWTPVMLATMKSLGVTPGFIIDHDYPQNPGGETDAGLLQEGATIASDAVNLRKMINDYTGAAFGSGIELALTELNSVSSDPGKQTTSLVNGLFMADAIGQFTQTEFNQSTWWALRNGSDASANNSSALYGWRNYGDYGVVASGDVSGVPANSPYPAFYAAKLLTHWGRGGDAVISATSDYSLLSVYGARLVNGSVALLVINKHPTNDLAAQVGIGNFTPGSASAAVYFYGKPNDLGSTDITTGTASVSGTGLTYTFPSYSMTVVLVKSQFEAWREAYFSASQLSNWAISGDAGMPAQDGVPNLVKYAFGLNPDSRPEAWLPRQSVADLKGGSYLTLTFTQLKTLGDVAYDVQVSSDLVNWQSGLAMRVDDGSTNTAVYRDSLPLSGVGKRFMRLRIIRQ